MDPMRRLKKAKRFFEDDVAAGNEVRQQEEEKEMESKNFTMELAGRELTIEFGKYAQQAGGSAFVRYGDTVVMVNATMSDSVREGVDFFPLTIDFEEKQYSVGKIPGGFIKREGRPTEKATLTCRLIDRPLRPLFPKGMRNDVQVVATVLSVDKDIPPEVPAMIGSSAALAASNIRGTDPPARWWSVRWTVHMSSIPMRRSVKRAPCT